MSKISPKQIDWNQPISGSLTPISSTSFDLGSELYRWDALHIATGSIYGDLDVFGNISSSTVSGIGNVEDYSASVAFRNTRLETAMSGSRRLYVSPSGSDDNDGSKPHLPFKTIKAAVDSIVEKLGPNYPNALNPENYTIYVGSGDYEEDNPINVPAGVSIIGDTLRTTRLKAKNPKKDFFFVDAATYFSALRFLDLQFPAFAFSFPCSTAEATISNGQIVSAEIVHTMDGYTDGPNQDIGIIVEHADSGSVDDYATITADIVDGKIVALNIIDGGANYADDEKPHISIPAPTDQRPIIVTSPYIQNCSSITGPFDTNGVKVQVAPPYDLDDVDGDGSGRKVDRLGAGGGLRIDGNLVADNSPLESFVADAFTQVNQGGPGHLVTNNGYAQFVSCFTTYCTYGFKVSNGGFANNSNSVIDFGEVGLLSKTYFPTAFNTGSSLENQYSSVSGISIIQDGAGYTELTASVEFGPPNIPGGINAEGYANITNLGTVGEIVVTNGGTGYTSEPIVIIEQPTGQNGVQADARAIINGITEMLIELEDGLVGVEISSNMILDGVNYLVTDVSGSSGEKLRRISTYPRPPKIEIGDEIKFHKLSNISTGGLVFEYVGSGITYNSLPKFGGIPKTENEIKEIEPGRVFYTTIDNIGNLRVGDFFEVDQLTGEITIDANNLRLTGIDEIGPFRRNEVPVGEVLRELSNNTDLRNSQGIVGEDTATTQYAVYTYVNEYSQSANDRLDLLEATASFHDERLDILEAAMSASKRLYVSPSGSDSNDGTKPHKPFQTIKAAVDSIVEELGPNYPNALNPVNYTIFVGSGDYYEDNPINVPAGVSVVGDTLRTTRLWAKNPKKDFFFVDSADYFYNLRFLDLQYPAFAFSFPCSTAEATISNGAITSVDIIHDFGGYPDGSNQDIGILVEHADAAHPSSSAVLTADIVGGQITNINVVDGGVGYADDEKPHISIPAPVSARPIVVTSPYIQNCSSITGPFDTNGVKVQVAPPYDENNIDGNGRKVDPLGAGGGIRVDGNLIHPQSPLESFVADAFTQVNQGGPGHLVTNNGYAQFVSCFTTFCTYGFKVSSGGFANNSNSVIDFGNEGLVSKTYYPTAFNTGSSLENRYSRVSGVTITQDGAGYAGPTASVEFGIPDILEVDGGLRAEGYATITLNGTVGDVVITEPGRGYTTVPGMIIAQPENTEVGVQAIGIPQIDGIKNMYIELEDGLTGVEISSNMILNGVNYLVTDVSGSSGDKRRWITTYPDPPKIEIGDDIQFHKLSNISTGGLVFEYVGSGITYNALTKYGGVPDAEKEIVEVEPGKVFYTTIDNIGNLMVGDFFRVDQLTGEITIDANNFTLTGIDSIGPFRRNEVPVGVVLREVSNNSTLQNSQGIVGEDTTPTQFAVYTYVNEYSQSANDRLDDLEADTFTINGTQNEIEIIGSNNQFLIDNPIYQIGLPDYVDITDRLRVPNLNVTNDTLITGSVRISGSLTVDGQTILRSGTLDSSSIQIYGEMEVLNQQLSNNIETAKITIENLGQIGNRDSGLVLDLGGIF